MVSDGLVYEGEWKDGCRCGEGREENSSTSMEYNGQWKDSKYHGFGIKTFEDGSVYTGLWRRGRRHGNGELINTGGVSYQGGWLNNLKHGDGVVHDSLTGYRFQGRFDRDLPDGPGLETKPSGERIKGSWSQGVRIAADSTGGEKVRGTSPERKSKARRRRSKVKSGKRHASDEAPKSCPTKISTSQDQDQARGCVSPVIATPYGLMGVTDYPGTPT